MDSKLHEEVSRVEQPPRILLCVFTVYPWKKRLLSKGSPRLAFEAVNGRTAMAVARKVQLWSQQFLLCACNLLATLLRPRLHGSLWYCELARSMIGRTEAMPSTVGLLNNSAWRPPPKLKIHAQWTPGLQSLPLWSHLYRTCLKLHIRAAPGSALVVLNHKLLFCNKMPSDTDPSMDWLTLAGILMAGVRASVLYGICFLFPPQATLFNFSFNVVGGIRWTFAPKKRRTKGSFYTSHRAITQGQYF